MRPLRFACLFVILISTMLLAQSNPVPQVDQPKAMPVAQKPNLALHPYLSQMLQGLSSDRHGKTSLTTQRLRGSSPQPSGVTFAPIVTYGSGGIGAQWVTVADVNGDGNLDLLVANGCSDSTCVNGSVGVLLGNGDGTFQAALAYGSGGVFSKSFYLIAVADVNGDARLDVVVANYGGAGGVSDGAVGVLLGNGDGTFQTSGLRLGWARSPIGRHWGCHWRWDTRRGGRKPMFPY